MPCKNRTNDTLARSPKPPRLANGGPPSHTLTSCQKNTSVTEQPLVHGACGAASYGGISSSSLSAQRVN